MLIQPIINLSLQKILHRSLNIFLKKKYFGSYLFLDIFFSIQLQNTKRKMQNLDEILCSFVFFQDQSALNELKPKLIPLLKEKKDITQQNSFDDFYRNFMMFDQIEYNAIVKLFEDMCKSQIWNKSQKYLLYHWLYYQAFRVKTSINQEGAMQFIKGILEMKKDSNSSLENIATQFQFNAKQSTMFKTNIQKSPIFDYFQKYQIVPSLEQNPQNLSKKSIDKTEKIFAQKLKTLGLNCEEGEKICFQAFVQPKSLFLAFRNKIKKHYQRIQMDDSFYCSILQAFLASKQLFELKGYEIIQAWTIYQIKLTFKFKLPIEDMFSIFNQKKITFKKFIEELAKKEYVQTELFQAWKSKHQDKIEIFDKRMTDSQNFISFNTLSQQISFQKIEQSNKKYKEEIEMQKQEKGQVDYKMLEQGLQAIEQFEDESALLFEGSNKVQQMQHQVISSRKQVSRFKSQNQTQFLEQLIKKYMKTRSQLEIIFQNKQYKQIRNATASLKSNFELVENCKKSIVQMIKKQFQQVVEQSTSFISQSKQNQYYYEIRSQTIKKIQQNISNFQNTEQQGPIFDEVKVYQYKQQIISKICSFGRQLIDQIMKKMQSESNKEMDQSKIYFIQLAKTNLSKIRQIKLVDNKIGIQINRLWIYFQKFIQKQTTKLNQFLSNQKINNLNTLKNFQLMIDRVQKFSEGDNYLHNSTNKLKLQIKKSITEHINKLKNKIDQSKITLKLKNTVEWVELSKIFQKFKEVQTFFLAKFIYKPNYRNANSINETIQINSQKSNFQQNKNKLIPSEILLSKIDINNSEDQAWSDQLIQQTYASIIKKLVYPFHQITEQSKKAKEKGIKKITQSYLHILNDFLHYKSKLFENGIDSNKDIQMQIQKLNSQQNNYISMTRGIVSDLRQYFEQLYHESIEENNAQMQIFRLQPQKIKQFRQLCNVLLIIKQNKHLKQFFLEENLCCTQYIQKIIKMLTISNQEIDKYLSNKKGNGQNMDNLIYLKNQILQMNKFDKFDFENNKTSLFEFTKIYKKVTDDLKKLQEMQQKDIISLFKGQTIILSDVERMYRNLINDELKNSQNLILFYDNLKAYIHDKLLKHIHAAKQQYQKEEIMSLENQNTHTYIVGLYKAFNCYQGLKKFISPKFMEVLTMNQSYFSTETNNFQIQQKLKHTYEAVKLKLQAFEYKKKPKQFEKINNAIKKAEFIVERVTDKTVYSQLYNFIQSQQNGETDFKGNKFSQRLKYLMNKNANKVKDLFANPKNEKLQQFLQGNNFVNLYNNLTQQQMHVVNIKIQKIIQQKLKILENASQKIDEKQNIEQNLNHFLDKLPPKIRHQYMKKIDKQKKINQDTPKNNEQDIIIEKQQLH